MDVYVNGKKFRLDPSRSIGKGGEADVFDFGRGLALKVFKPPTHPDYRGLPEEQSAARERIAVHQEKLRSFPRNLPASVVKPEELATDSQGKQIVGYTMKFLSGCELLLRYSDRTFRQAGIDNEAVRDVFLDLHGTVSGVHRAGVVIGDFNDLNVLVSGRNAHLIDADSFQFGTFYCQVFTAKFVDPTLCDPNAGSLMLHRPHTANSDWYAFAVMLMQSLLFVDPYGGIYRPKDPANKVPHELRPLHRVSVFHPEVRYPKPATPYAVLPDDLLHYFHLVFEKDARGEFPTDLLENLRWTKCAGCGTEHARARCPECAQASPTAIKEVVIVRGTVTATRIFWAAGMIVSAAMRDNDVQWLQHVAGERKFKRETGETALNGDLDPRMRFALCGKRTLIARDGLLLTLSHDTDEVDRIAVDSFGNIPMFATNERYRYWLSGGQLLRDGRFGPVTIGAVLQNQTLFWVGPKFGFGFYRAGELCVAFVFDAEQGGLNDNVRLPGISGKLIDATCAFSNDLCWFFMSENTQGRTINRCAVIRPDGAVAATAEAEQGDGTWLATLHGKCALGNFLLAATDDGIVRLEIHNKTVVKVREFPDTEPFVNAECSLFAGRDGLYVVSRKEILRLTIKA